MSLSERIQNDLVTAMKAKDTARVGVLRLIKTAIQNKKIELRKELTVDEENQLLQTMVKQRNESIETYRNAGRTDLADKEEAEKALLQEFLPEEVRPEEVARIASEVVTELGASSPKDMGRVMKETMTRLKSTGKTVDGKAVNQAVRAALG